MGSRDDQKLTYAHFSDKVLTFIYFRKADGDEFEPCLMYDFSKVPSLKSGSVFSSALASRWKNLTTMKCEANPLAPENARFMYDQSEGLDTIVNDVRYGSIST